MCVCVCLCVCVCVCVCCWKLRVSPTRFEKDIKDKLQVWNKLPLICVLCFCVSQGRGRDCSGDEAVAEGTERGTQLLSAGHVSAAAPEIHCLGEVHHESGKHKPQGLNILLCIYNICCSSYAYMPVCVCSTVRCAERVIMKTCFCCVMAVIRGVTPIATNPR